MNKSKGLDIYTKTWRHYPQMAAQGWCWSTNMSKTRPFNPEQSLAYFQRGYPEATEVQRSDLPTYDVDGNLTHDSYAIFIFVGKAKMEEERRRITEDSGWPK